LAQCERRVGLEIGHGEIFPALETAKGIYHTNDVFTPTAEDLAYYKGLLTAMEEVERQGTAAVTYAGTMVDMAMGKTAQQVLAPARAIGTTT
jgi:citrate lyase beta subunit